MKSNELKEYLFSKGYKIFRVKGMNILEAKTKAEEKHGKGCKFMNISKIIFIDI
jgi:hypothetical protein